MLVVQFSFYAFCEQLTKNINKVCKKKNHFAGFAKNHLALKAHKIT